jgi:hypothetical protein
MERARADQNQNAKQSSRLAAAACGLIKATLLKGDAGAPVDANIFGAE